MKLNTFGFLKIVSALAIFLGFLYVNFISVDPDLWWHLKVGEWTIENKSIQQFDEYSHTMPGYRWVNHEWLVDSWLWLMKLHNLWWIAVMVFTILAFIPFLIWVRRSAYWLDLVIVFIAATFMTHLIGIRPQMISFLFFFLVFEILYKKYAGEKNYAVLLPLIFFVWANLHGAFAAGLLVFGIIILTHHLLPWIKNKAIQREAFLYDTLLFVGSFAVTFINPYGANLHKSIFQAATSYEVLKYISEWQSVLHFTIFSSLLFISILIIFTLFFKVYKKYPVPFLVAGIITFLMFLKSIRHGPLFLVTSIPILSAGTKILKEKINISKKLIVLLMLIAVGAFGYRLYSYEKFSFPADSAIEFLQKSARREKEFNLLNLYGWGGYLIWHAPETKVFIDGRMPHWVDKNGGSAMKDYAEIFFESDDAWKNIFAKRNITTVLIPSDVRKKSYLAEKIEPYLADNAYFKKFYNFMVARRPIDLKNRLLDDGWDIAYQDEIAIILTTNGHE